MDGRQDAAGCGGFGGQRLRRASRLDIWSKKKHAADIPGNFLLFFGVF
jgi:hypothetical protein